MKKIVLALSLCLVFFTSVVAQEMNFTVSVNTPKLQKTDPQVFKDLENAIQEFMNTRKWIEDVYEPEERIQGNLQITIKEELSANEFSADIQIQASRPVFGGDYKTVLLSHADKNIIFTYEQFQPLQFTKNSFTDNLTSVLTFYVYTILGMDYDSFSPYGGEPYYQIAQDIVATIPNSLTGKYKGWRSVDGNRNRHWIMENILSPRVRPYRQAMYDYHRLGLDMMHQDVVTARSVMLKALDEIGKVNKAYPSSMIIQMFANAKGNELVEIFKNGDSQQKTKVRQLMSKMDASNATKYRAIGR